MKTLILALFFFSSGCVAYPITDEMIAKSRFPPIEFVVGSTTYAFMAANTPGIGHILICIKHTDAGWMAYYGQGRDINEAEIVRRGGMMGFVRLHLTEINRLLAQDHDEYGTETIPDIFIELEAMLQRVTVNGNKLELR